MDKKEQMEYMDRGAVAILSMAHNNGFIDFVKSAMAGELGG